MDESKQSRPGDISAARRENEIMRSYLFTLVMSCALVASGQKPPISPGVVHGSVPVVADPTNSYALYLPANYSPEKRWPLVLVFDPFARGEVSVKLFHEAAERYGFIVVGSNNSRNFADPSNAIRLLGRRSRNITPLIPSAFTPPACLAVRVSRLRLRWRARTASLA